MVGNHLAVTSASMSPFTWWPEAKPRWESPSHMAVTQVHSVRKFVELDADRDARNCDVPLLRTDGLLNTVSDDEIG